MALSVVVGLSGALRAQNSTGRPPITGIATVGLYASDLNKAQQFYGTFLGLRQVGKQNKAGGQHYRVNSAQSVDIGLLPGGETDYLAYVGFATTDANALRRYLLSKHVAVEGEVRKAPDGARLFWVKDPEGHRLQFVQLPAHAHSDSAKAANRPAAKEQPISRYVLHAGFIVHDRAAEDRFYRDVLGFVPSWQGGMNDSRTDWVDMRVPDGPDWIEYMMHSPAPPSAAESGVLNHFALGVKDIHQAAEMLQQRGWQPSARSKAQLGRDGKWQLNLYDPNGTRVELMEFVPVQTPCCSPYTLKPPASKE